MKILPALLLLWVGGFLIGYAVRGQTETYMESEAAHLETEQAGMAKMEKAMRNLITGVCVR